MQIETPVGEQPFFAQYSIFTAQSLNIPRMRFGCFEVTFLPTGAGGLLSEDAALVTKAQGYNKQERSKLTVSATHKRCITKISSPCVLPAKKVTF